MNVIDWINMFATAVSETRRAGGSHRAPTNGACVYSPLAAYYDKFRRPVNANSYRPLSVVGGAIGMLYKMNAYSISGAEVGCQGRGWRRVFDGGGGADRAQLGGPAQVCAAKCDGAYWPHL